MLHSIHNSELHVSISDLGAELQSIRNSQGVEFLWQGDPAYWAGRSPNLFPYIGRMVNKQYTYLGKSYSMDIHGFALSSNFSVVEKEDSMIAFRLESNHNTLKQYPWEFSFTIIYRLNGNRLEIEYHVENQDKTKMLFAVGGHPGFRVPLSDGERFEDYRLRFVGASHPGRVIFNKECFVTGISDGFRLDENNSIPLKHDLFDDDAIVLSNSAKTVVLEKENGKHSVTVSFPDMEYIGFWHRPRTDAPYVCIEPWSSLPSLAGEKTMWERQKDLLMLEAGNTYFNKWWIEVK